MPLSITTAMCTSFKKECFEGKHNLAGTITVAGSATSGTTSVTSLASIADLAPGMNISGANITGTLSQLLTTTSIKADASATATSSGNNYTFKGDAINCALFGSAGSGGTYGSATSNYSNMGTDEVANGGGYATSGFTYAAGAMLTPGSSTSQSYCQPNANPSWTGATFITSGCLFYNNTKLGAAICVENFGSQSVSNGTITLLLPVNGGGTSLLQLN